MLNTVEVEKRVPKAHINATTQDGGASNNPPWMSVAMPSKRILRHARGALSRLLRYLCLIVYLPETPPSRGAQHRQCSTPFCGGFTPDLSQHLLPKLNFSAMSDHDTPPERLVDAVLNLKPFLPAGCEIWRQGDLKFLGTRPIAAGGSADVWVGERDGATVVIKSFRCYSSSSHLQIYLVSCSAALMYLAR